MIRVLQEYEIPAALSLAREVFTQYVAPGYTPEGNAEFEKALNEQQILAEVRGRQLVFWGDFEQNYLVGMSAMTTYGHIKFFFVHSQWQNHGVGKQLLDAMYHYAFDQLHVADLSVNASPYAVGIYQRMGFSIVGQEQTVNGMKFTPMSMIKKRSVAPWLIPICVGGGVLLLVLIGLCIIFAKRVQKTIVTAYNNGGYYSDNGDNYNDGSDSYGQDDGEEYYYYYGDEGQEDPNSDDIYGYDSGSDDTTIEDNSQDHSLYQIPVYMADTITYSTTEENYSLAQDQGTQSLNFNVNYPVISGMENTEVQDQVNQMIKDQAMYMVDFMYTNPSEDVNSYIQEQQAYFGSTQLMSDVAYSISYADEGFMSIIFEDHYYLGSVYSEFVDIRTLNVNLDDGTTYDVSDIVNVDDTFMSAWMASAQAEVPDSILFTKLTQDDFKVILDGSKNSFQYGRAFFVDAEGIEIGFSYHYSDENDVSRGWLTAPFTADDIKNYKTESDFWTRVFIVG